MTPPGRDTNPSQVSLPADAGSHLPTPEGWKTELRRKRGGTNIFKFGQSWASKWGPCGQKAEILPTALTMPANRASLSYGAF